MIETIPSQQQKDTQQPETSGNIQPDSVQEAAHSELQHNAKEVETYSIENAPYCILPEREKVTLMILASFAAIISPMSSSIYFPAINNIAKDLNVSITLINLTVTTYLILQGIAPSLIANFSDIHGRRPAYLICFTIYIAANIGLALQSSYAALMVLRCLQSSGSSGTIALGSATVSDLSTRAERGKYIGYATMGVTLGPALGPVIGGLLDHFLGWRWIFWFLVILSSAFGATVAIIYPETCRAVVGNGSVPAPKWNRSVYQVVKSNLCPQKMFTGPPNYDTLQNRNKRRANPLASAMIATEKEAFFILIYGSLLYAGFMSVLSTLTSELQLRFDFNSIQIGLCYLPLGFGSLTSRWTVGFLLDKNFKREARRQGLPIVKNRQQEIEKFNIEIARLTITIPLVYIGALCLIAYGWVMEYKTSLAGPMVTLFFMGHCITGAFSSLNTLIVDTHRQSPATAVAANNLWRCLVGAGAIAIAAPLIDRIGIGWTATFIAFLWIFFSPIMWAVYKWGYAWREKSRLEEQERTSTTQGNREL
ncbi:putative MFS transporter [Talaromyces proteolyticus]|uniref:MFS transporter n=1 Tax=Talaromyces proteolyticus TaxID=1131652 RepID=A0AAD4PUN2_9EURO|nr:putative MFS transporter [Talaromyces proteolyticus]KAH8690282.1 putative MFS transporter [Talaromyces proteolyticus]